MIYLALLAVAVLSALVAWRWSRLRAQSAIASLLREAGRSAWDEGFMAGRSAAYAEL